MIKNVDRYSPTHFTPRPSPTQASTTGARIVFMIGALALLAALLLPLRLTYAEDSSGAVYYAGHKVAAYCAPVPDAWCAPAKVMLYTTPVIQFGE